MTYEQKSKITEIFSHRCADKEEKQKLLEKYGSLEQGLELLNKRLADIVGRFNKTKEEQDSCVENILIKIDTSSMKDLNTKLKYGISLLEERKDILSNIKSKENKDEEQKNNSTNTEMADLIFHIDQLIPAKISLYNEQCIPVYKYCSAKFDEMQEKRDELNELDGEYRLFYNTTVQEIKHLARYEKNLSIFKDNSEKIKLSNHLIPTNCINMFFVLEPFYDLRNSMNEFEILVKETRFSDLINDKNSETQDQSPASSSKQNTETNNSNLSA